MPLTLHYLSFDYSEDGDGHGVFDAMASVAPAQAAALRDEAAALLGRLCDAFPAGPGPLEDGCDWQFELSASREWSADEGLRFDPQQRRLAHAPGTPAEVRWTLALTISGTPSVRDHLQELLQAAGSADD